MVARPFAALGALVTAAAVLAGCSSGAATPASTDPTIPVLQILPTACPRADRVGTNIASAVRNSGNDLKTSLLPADTPIGGRICSYNGLNADVTAAFTLRLQRALEEPSASALARQARDISLAHTPGGQYNCPSDDGSMTFVLFSYSSRAPITLAVKDNGCQSVTNGSVSVGIAGATPASGRLFEAFTTAVARAST